MTTDAVGGVLLAAVSLYAVLGGADFGAGLWDLLAGDAERGGPPRRLIDDAITAVWEANHVWLIFDLVICWTAFPDAFTAVMTTVAVPLWLAVAGVVLRGAGFAFRKELAELRYARLAGATFALSSLLTPFFLGTVIGAVATGRIPADPAGTSLHAWTNPTSVLIGLLFVAACGYLAAVYLCHEAARRGDDPLRSYFARRAAVAATVAGGLSIAAFAELHSSNRMLFDRLSGRALPLVMLTAVCGLTVVIRLAIGRSRGNRLIAALGVAAVVWGWGVAQYPVLLPGTSLSVSDAGAPHATYVAVLVVAVAVVLLIVPGFLLLFRLQGSGVLDDDGHGYLGKPADPV